MLSAGHLKRGWLSGRVSGEKGADCHTGGDGEVGEGVGLLRGRGRQKTNVFMTVSSWTSPTQPRSQAPMRESGNKAMKASHT